MERTFSTTAVKSSEKEPRNESLPETEQAHFVDVCLLSFFFLIWGDTRSLRMPALRSASQAGPMHNPREGTSVVLCNTIRLT